MSRRTSKGPAQVVNAHGNGSSRLRPATHAEDPKPREKFANAGRALSGGERFARKFPAFIVTTQMR
jgi:hypothetical protein